MKKDYNVALHSMSNSKKEKHITKVLNDFGYSGILDFLIFLENLKVSNVLADYDFFFYTNVAELTLWFKSRVKADKFYKHLGYFSLKEIYKVTDNLDILFSFYENFNGARIVFDYSKLNRKFNT